LIQKRIKLSKNQFELLFSVSKLTKIFGNKDRLFRLSLKT
jgi:hypothetical protein